MIYLKTSEEIKIMRKAGRIAARVMRGVKKSIRPGVKTRQLDKIVEETIKKLGAESSFKKVKGYYNSICTTPNDLVVHGIPGDYSLKEGDILGIDLGAYFQGFHSDMSETFAVGKISAEREKFLFCGKRALADAIKQVRIGNHIGDISNAIQSIVEKSGYSIVREFVGHGIGRKLHEDPVIPGRGEKGSGSVIEEGLVLAVEVIYNQGGHQVKMLRDGWTIATKDGTASGLFESTVTASKNGPLLLTKE